MYISYKGVIFIRITVPFTIYPPAYREALNGDSIFTEYITECVAVILKKPNILRLQHIPGGYLFADGLNCFNNNILNNAAFGDRVIIVYGSSYRPDIISRQGFFNQPPIQNLIHQIGGQIYVSTYIGTSVEVFPNGTVWINERPSFLGAHRMQN